jgi:hypothetical protein
LQISLYDDATKRVKWESIESCVDKFRIRYGKTSVTRAVLLGADIIGESDPLTHDIHPVTFNFYGLSHFILQSILYKTYLDKLLLYMITKEDFLKEQLIGNLKEGPVEKYEI